MLKENQICQCGSCENVFHELKLVNGDCPHCGSGNWVKGYIDDDRVDNYIPATETKEEVIKREYCGQGYIFKDWDAYKNHLDKVCYIPELSETKYTHRDFLNLCDGQEDIARALFEQVDWQHPETLIKDWYAAGELDNCKECGKMFLCYGKNSCPHCGADETE